MSTVHRSVIIDSRFNGPPDSGNGGYTCGLAAEAAAITGPAVVRLRLPPPLETELTVLDRDDAIELVDPTGRVVAIARPTNEPFDVPPAPSPSVVSAATRAFDVAGYAAHHPFERCFTCGPARAEGDGLRIFPAPIDETHRLVVWRWVPDRSMARGDDDLVDVPIVWSALDCPSGQAFIGDPHDPAGPSVLGQLAVSITRRPHVGEQVVVGGWQIRRDGRKLYAGSAAWTPDGELLAAGAATWIVLDADQSVAFGADPH